MLSRSKALANTAVDACIAAIEVYNKPDFRHREQAFAILMLNAWELLLKARVLQENNNKLSSIHVRERMLKADGTRGQRLVVKHGRGGNPITIDVTTAISLVKGFSKAGIDDACAENIHLLAEMRNKAVHFMNEDAGLSQRMQEVGTAALRNFMRAVQEWFDTDLSRYNFFLMPLAFHSPAEAVQSIAGANYNKETANFLEYLASQEKKYPSDASRQYNVSLQVDFKFVKAKGEGVLPVKLSTDPEAQKISLTEEQMNAKYPWDYATLMKNFVAKRPSVKRNNSFHAQMEKLKKNPNLCRDRYLNPVKASGTKTTIYSQAMLQELLKVYP